MERLTERTGNSILIKGCKTIFAATKRKKAHMQNAIVKLAAYEDTGLEPEEIKDLELLKRAVHASDLENREKMALLACISSIPAADVALVRHGHWVDVGGGYVACSECGEKHNWVSYRPDLCLDCGAKMDEEAR